MSAERRSSATGLLEERPAAARQPLERFRRRRLPLLVSLLVAAAGLLNLTTVVRPGLAHHLRRLATVLPGTVSHAAAAATVASGLLLLLLAKALRRRKRRAWRVAVVLLAADTVFHLVKGFGPLEALPSALVLGVLLLTRDCFQARGDPRTRLRAVGVFLLLVAVSVVLGVALLSVDFDTLVGPHPLGAEALQVIAGMAGVSGPLRYASPRFADLAYDVFAGLGLVTALTTAYLALRPAEPAPYLAPEDERRMRELLAAHGERDSLGYFALRRDKSVVWSATGKSAIAYRVVSGVMLASGDPLGDPEAWPGAIARFLEIAALHAWVPAVMGCSELAGHAWCRAGLAALELGDEAVVEVDQFSLEGRAMRNVRQTVARVERAGYTACVRRLADIPAAEAEQLCAQAARWRGAQTERGFSMALGRFADPSDGDCVAVTATDATGALRALLHFVPWGRDGLSLDLMRRDREAAGGLNEFLIVAALRAAPALGVARLSLNFAVFRSALERGERLGAGFVLRAWRGVLLFASRWFQIETLYRFNAKFRPVWQPRYLCYPSAADLPRIALAALEAEAFIVWPSPGVARLRRVLGRRPPTAVPSG